MARYRYMYGYTCMQRLASKTDDVCMLNDHNWSYNVCASYQHRKPMYTCKLYFLMVSYLFIAVLLQLKKTTLLYLNCGLWAAYVCEHVHTSASDRKDGVHVFLQKCACINLYLNFKRLGIELLPGERRKLIFLSHIVSYFNRFKSCNLTTCLAIRLSSRFSVLWSVNCSISFECKWWHWKLYGSYGNMIFAETLFWVCDKKNLNPFTTIVIIVNVKNFVIESAH